MSHCIAFLTLVVHGDPVAVGVLVLFLCCLSLWITALFVAVVHGAEQVLQGIHDDQ
jgi:hypothetical protein